MSASDDLKPWLDLQSATLNRVHPSWLRHVDPKLIVAARGNPFGRRWLANHLAQISPALFSLTVWRADAGDRLGTVTWLTRPLEDPMECALELGGLALAGALRTVVTRDDVMKLRTALGAARYDRVLQTPPDAGSPEHPAWTRGSVEEIAEHVARRGAMELAAYADNAHSAWGESIRLSFEMQWWADSLQWTLPAGVVESALRPADTLYEVVLTGTDA